MTRPCHSLKALPALLLLPNAALADNALNSQLLTSILTTSGMLALVIACFLGLTWLTRKLQATGFQQQRSLQVVESIPVGRNEKISIVKVGSNYQVLGITAHQITLLDTLDQLETEKADDKSQAWNWAQQFLQNKAS